MIGLTVVEKVQAGVTTSPPDGRFKTLMPSLAKFELFEELAPARKAAITKTTTPAVRSVFFLDSLFVSVPDKSEFMFGAMIYS